MSDETMRRGIARYLRGGMAGFSFDELIEIHHKTAQHLDQTANSEFFIYRSLGHNKYYNYKAGNLFVLCEDIWHRVKTLQYTHNLVKAVTPGCINAIFLSSYMRSIEKIDKKEPVCQKCAPDVNRPS